MASVVKVIEVIAQSETGFDDAVRRAVKEASRTIHGIRHVWVDNFSAVVNGDQVAEYRVNAKISFVLDEGR